MDLTPQAAADDAWLRERLGARHEGCEQLPGGEFLVTLVKQDGRRRWFLGATAGDALVKARALVESLIEQAKGTR
jgi:hypothetical protein